MRRYFGEIPSYSDPDTHFPSPPQANEKLRAKGKAPPEGSAKPWWETELEEAERQQYRMEDDDEKYFR